MSHVMSPNGVAALLLLALVVDYMSIGPNSIRDRIAFFLGLAAIRQGFAGSPLANWTVGAASGLIDQLKHMSGSAYIAGASATVLIGAGIGVLAIYTVGALLPEKLFAKRLGSFARIKFPASGLHRLNYKLWVCAALLGTLGDLPRGLLGELLRNAIDFDVHLCASIPFSLFGVS